MFRFLATHTLTLTNAIAIFCSIGGWFLWNIILSSTYKPDSKIYYVRDTFLHGFGASSWPWWLTLILILAAVMVFEMATQAILDAFFTPDAFVFQVLEKDPNVKRRFEEEASAELQMGWARDPKEVSKRAEEERVRAVVGMLEEREERRREGEVVEILRMREAHAAGEEEEHVTMGGGGGGGGDGAEISKILSRGYGDVKAV